MTIEFINLINLPKNIQIEARNWRNNPEVLPYFVIQNIDEQTHQNWLDSMHLPNPRNIAFVIKFNQDYVGMIYLLGADYVAKLAEIGIYIHNSNMRGKGIGNKAFEYIINFAKIELKFKKLTLRVFKNNFNAIKLYEKFGFKFSKNLGENLLEFTLCLKPE